MVGIPGLDHEREELAVRTPAAVQVLDYRPSRQRSIGPL